VSTKSISTSIGHTTCDVCGRTLLRGERAEIYVSGGTRRSVCELCTSRALHGGWVREGTIPSYEDSGARVDRRRSLLGRFRARREAAIAEPAPLDDEGYAAMPPAPEDGSGNGSGRSLPGRARPARESRASREPRPVREPRPTRESRPTREPRPVREPRHVRAVPTSTEHKVSSAVSLFNNSEHPRTVAGIARSLGVPGVTVMPAATLPSVVNVVIAWELCWYRYEVDLSDEVPTVRVSAQGYELDELEPHEIQYNAVADDRGTLSLG
jgi:hypothetical protein